MESRFSKKPLATQHKERTDEIDLGPCGGRARRFALSFDEIIVTTFTRVR